MIWIISFFTLIGLNFTVWSIVGIIRFYSEERPCPKYVFMPEKEPPHSLVRWLIMFLNITGLTNIMKFTLRLPGKTIALFIIIFTKIHKFNSGLATKLKFPFSILKGNLEFAKLSPDFTFAKTRPATIYTNSRAANIKQASKVNINEVAAIIPAHNEEHTIGSTLRSLKKVMPAKNIYVGSDHSSDRTVEIAQEYGCNVFDISPNIGKANVLDFLIRHYDIVKRYKAVIIVDADSEIDDNYLKNSLPLFDDPNIAAIAAHAMSKWTDHWPPRRDMIYAAYRIRLYRVLQAVFRYGQTWKHANVSMIVPGFASIYRTSVLPHIDINAPGLIIEDYNMTFEIHHKKLGIIAYSPAVKGYSRDPLNLRDYFKQIKRWNLGFWQTIKRHNVWKSFFWLSLSLYILEMILFGAFLLIVPLFFFYFIANSFEPLTLPFIIPFLEIDSLSFIDILIGVFLVDYLITIIVSLYEKKPILLIYGLLFIFLRYLDAIVLFYTVPLALTAHSDGRWVSPERKTATS